MTLFSPLLPKNLYEIFGTFVRPHACKQTSNEVRSTCHSLKVDVSTQSGFSMKNEKRAKIGQVLLLEQGHIN